MPKLQLISLNEIAAIVLAGGKGTRMRSELPKVLHQIGNKPIASHILTKLKNIGLEQIYVVLGFQAKEVKAALGSGFNYVKQKKQLGTGHAVLQVLPKITSNTKTILVVNGDDSIFYKLQTIKNILHQHSLSGKKMTILTVVSEAEVSGRVIRNAEGGIIDIKPNSQMTKEELSNNKEFVCGLYVFDHLWLGEKLPKVEISPKGEYNITSLIKVAISEHCLNGQLLTDPKEWRSINTQDELKLAQTLWLQQNNKI